MALPIALAACSTPQGGTPPPSSSPVTPPAAQPVVSEVVGDLDVPWDLAFLPDGAALVTLRDRGEVVRIEDEEVSTVGTVPGVVAEGEGGLLGLAISPDFARDRSVFVYVTTADDNRVLRMALGDNGLGSPEPVLTGIPKAGNHNGGRIAFGPDGQLYVATGDAGDTSAAQDPDSLGGKILRITPDGDAARGNPVPGSPVWSSGHRNVQGLAWGEDETMWASEFGQDTWDELNRIVPGGNYGWPQVEGAGGRSGFIDPVATWSTADASPSGIAVAKDGSVVMAALRGKSLWRVPVEGEGGDARAGEPERLLEGQHGRLRDVELAPDGSLWVLTSNTFRGEPREGDDRVLKVTLR
ncbi:glucose sorbosone dehydrogenase [Janibacter sp. Soil728]|nr:glucose sorbosone dehydrogenase [Janibacter sp. Soil728]